MKNFFTFKPQVSAIMRKQYHLLLIAVSIISLFNSCNDKSKKGIEVTLGLAKEDPAKMSRIPIADVPFGGTELLATVRPYLQRR